MVADDRSALDHPFAAASAVVADDRAVAAVAVIVVGVGRAHEGAEDGCNSKCASHVHDPNPGQMSVSWSYTGS